MTRDDQLTELLHEAVDRIEPDDRLHAIHARTSAATRRRTTVLTLGGAVLASAAAVVAVAAVGPGVLSSDEPGPAEGSSASSPADSTGSDDAATEAPEATRAVAVYYLGDTPAGVRLYREFRSVDEPDDGPAASLELLSTTPQDPDYRTVWPADAFAGGAVEGDRITVELGDASLVDRPATITDDEARISVQQAVYTLQAYAQQQLPVEFAVDGEPVERVLGVPTPQPVTAAPMLEVLSNVNLTRPDEGATASGTLQVEGRASSNEGTVPWTLEDSSGEVVDQGFFTAEGYIDRLYPFAGDIDVSTLPPGSYTLVVSTEDASGGAEGPGAHSDTRTFVIE